MDLHFGRRIAASAATLMLATLPFAASAQEPPPDPEPQLDFGSQFGGIDDLSVLTEVGAWAEAGQPDPVREAAPPPASAVEDPQPPADVPAGADSARPAPVALPAAGATGAARPTSPLYVVALLACGVAAVVAGLTLAERRA